MSRHKVDAIDESTSGSGVTIEGVLVKDGIVAQTGVNVYYPELYGTVDYTGIADSYAAIQGACTAANAAGGGIVQLRTGTLSVASVLSIPSGVWLRGAGIDATTLRRLGTGTHNVVQNLNFTGSQDTDCWVTDLTIDGNKGTGTGLHGLRWTNVLRPVCERVRFTSCEAANIALFGNGTTPGRNEGGRFTACLSDSSDDSGIDLSDAKGFAFDLRCKDNAQTDFNIEPRNATESVVDCAGTIWCESTVAASGADIGWHAQGYSFGSYEGVIENITMHVVARAKDVGVRFEGAKLKNITLIVAVQDCREQGVLGKTGATATTGVTVIGRVENCGTSGAGATYYAGAKLEACTGINLSGLAVLDYRATKLHNYGVEETAASTGNNLNAMVSGFRQTAILSLGTALEKQSHGTTKHFGFLRIQPPSTADQAYRMDIQRTVTAGYMRAVDDNTGNYQDININDDRLQVNETVGANETCILIRVDRAGVKSTSRVSIGAADSGGAGFKVLRVPN